MLEVGENFVVLNMVQNVPAHNVFKKFTGNTSQRNWFVVFSHKGVHSELGNSQEHTHQIIPFLKIGATFENWCNVSRVTSLQGTKRSVLTDSYC